MPKFKKDALQELVNDESETLKKVSDTITGKRRWSLSHKLIFCEIATGRFFLTHYRARTSRFRKSSRWSGL